MSDLTPALLDEAADYIDAWNDADDSTANQVVTELRACAADLRQGAQ